MHIYSCRPRSVTANAALVKDIWGGRGGGGAVGPPDRTLTVRISLQS